MKETNLINQTDTTHPLCELTKYLKEYTLTRIGKSREFKLILKTDSGDWECKISNVGLNGFPYSLI